MHCNGVRIKYIVRSKIVILLLTLFACSSEREERKQEIILIDIWEPWCAPCIAGFEKLATLDDFDSVEVVLYSADATPNESVIIPARNGAVGIKSIRDPFRFLYSFCNVPSLPYWVVMDVSADSIIYSGPPIWNGDFTGDKRDLSQIADYVLADSVVEIRIAISKNQSFNPDWGKALRFDRERKIIEAESWSLSNFIGVQLLNLPHTRINTLVQDLYVDLYVQYKAPELPATRIANHLLQNFGWEIDSTDIYTQVYFLENKKLEPGNHQYQSSNWIIEDRRLIARNINMTILASAFESWYERPFLSNAPDSLTFDLNFTLPENSDSLNLLLNPIGINIRKTNEFIVNYILH